MPANNADFDKIVDAYRDRYGIDLSHMRMKWSKHPVYNNGRRSYDFADDETGGSWVNDGTVRINPNIGPVMKRFGIDGMTQAEFRRRIIAHELAHEIWQKQARKEKVKKLVNDVLAKAMDENFTTPYLKTVPEQKMNEETFAEYMSDQLNKNAESYSLKEDPTYEDALNVFNKLDFDDRANIAPRHPDFFRKVPDDILFDRQVAIDGDGNPVGFNEFYYGRNKLGRRQPPHNAIAVVPEARGNGLARLMVDAAVRKAKKENIKRLVWEAFADNEPSIRAAMSAGFEDATPKNAKGYRKFVYNVSEKKASSLDLKKLFPNSKFPTEDELKEKEKSFSVGDRVKVSDNIRCRQKGHVGTIVRIDPENKHGWKSFVVEFDDKKYGSIGFSSGNINKVEEKNASSKKETYESGEGAVESYTPDKTDDHDELVLRLKNGKKIVVSNNTKLGIRVIPADGDRVGYNGYRINGTNVVHKVHGNKHQRGGWLEYSENTPSRM